jgi:hypothetical protein
MNTLAVYGTKEELSSIAGRFKTALRGGDKLNNSELIALAQLSKITGLNPFIGELWYIPGKGPMIGIVGARRLWNEKSAAGGGWSSVEILPCTPQEAGYAGDVKDLAAAFKATAHDSAATLQYQKMFTDTINTMRSAGSTDPFGDAKQICGPRPQWEGYGYSTVSETSRMNKTQLARKRAEADALKKCINVPFGLEVSAEYETAPAEYAVNAEVTDVTDSAGEENQDADQFPNSTNELKALFAKEYNAALKVSKGQKLPSIAPDATPDQIKAAVSGIRAIVASVEGY